MLSRIWRGWTLYANADAYERLLREEVFTAIKGRRIPGFIDIQLLRRELVNKVEFVTIMRFETIEAVKAFAGEDYEVAVVPPKARQLLDHFDQRSQHYNIRISENQVEVSPATGETV